MGVGSIRLGMVFEEGIFGERDFFIGHVFFIMGKNIFTERVDNEEITILVFGFGGRF